MFFWSLTHDTKGSGASGLRRLLLSHFYSSWQLQKQNIFIGVFSLHFSLHLSTHIHTSSHTTDFFHSSLLRCRFPSGVLGLGRQRRAKWAWLVHCRRFPIEHHDGHYLSVTATLKMHSCRHLQRAECGRHFPFGDAFPGRRERQ